MNTDGAEGNRSKKRHKQINEVMVRGGTPLSTPKKRIGSPKQLPSVATKRHYQQKRGKWKYFMLNEFKKEKPPTFDGEEKKVEEAETWLLGMKFFRLHNYSENMNARATTFSLRGKVDV